MIVVSILLAFVIQAWWDSAGARKQERAYLLSLREEFAEAQSQVPESVAERARALLALEALIHQTQGEPRAPADSLLLWMSSLSYPVTFDPPQITAWEDTRVGGNSPWSPGWSTPAAPEDNRWEVAATFRRPGTYILRALAHDGGLPTFEDVTVTVSR